MSFKTFKIVTLGCKVNQYDSGEIAAQLAAAGMKPAADGGDADIIVVNTCAVTHVVEAKCRKAIRKAKTESPGSRLFVTGCFADRAAEEIKKMPEVAGVFVNSEKPNAANLILGKDVEIASSAIICESRSALAMTKRGLAMTDSRERALLKIQDGCDNFCAYCIVPHVRGNPRSRPPAEVLEEAKILADAGYPEIVVTGIHLGEYGKRESWDFAELLEKITDIPAVKRIRLSSIDAYTLDAALVKRLAAIPKLCEHFHVPLQSGDADVLKRMNRRYEPKEFLERVDLLKSSFDRPGITTDVMVGFPGEDEKAFENTLKMVRKVGFSRTHIFTYSERPGTPAAEFPDKVPRRFSAERYAALKSAAAETALEFAKKFSGEELEVVVEGKRKGGMLSGYSRRYLRMEFPGGASTGTIARIVMERPGAAVSRGKIAFVEQTCI
jgi:threonylcarbamoyladenosine tRNA methylthiotransferase MtaB